MVGIGHEMTTKAARGPYSVIIGLPGLFSFDLDDATPRRYHAVERSSSFEQWLPHQGCVSFATAYDGHLGENTPGEARTASSLVLWL